MKRFTCIRRILYRFHSRQSWSDRIKTCKHISKDSGHLCFLRSTSCFQILILLRIIVISETFCERSFTNGAIAATCGIKVGDSCDSITCNYGFQPIADTGFFNCTEDGTWDNNMTLLCMGTYFFYFLEIVTPLSIYPLILPFLYESK